MRRSAATALLVGAVLLQLGAQGCSETGSDSTAAAPSASGAPSSGSDAASAPNAQDSEASEARCRKRERAAAVGTAYRLQLAIDHLMQSTDVVSVKAATQVEARAERVRLEVAERCDSPSPATETFVRTALRRAGGPLSHRDLDAVLAAYAQWTEAVGVPMQAVRLRRAVHACRALRREVHASYRVWWAWSEAGRTWWIEMTYRNDLSRVISAGLSGRVRVSGFVGQYGYRPDGPPNQVLAWGGSSADYIDIRPGTSQKLVSPGAGPRVDTTADGAFDVLQVELTLEIPGVQAWWCSPPVPERT